MPFVSRQQRLAVTQRDPCDESVTRCETQALGAKLAIHVRGFSARPKVQCVHDSTVQQRFSPLPICLISDAAKNLEHGNHRYLEVIGSYGPPNSGRARFDSAKGVD